MRKNPTLSFSELCCAIGVMTTAGHDTIVVEPSATTTRFIVSARGLGHTADEIVEIPAPLVEIEVDVWQALQIEGWTVKKEGRGYTATRRTSLPALQAVA